MLFNSIDFLVFFPIVILIYYVLPTKVRHIWLLICSYYFYMSWNPKYVILILISTLSTYFGALLIDKIKAGRGRRLVLAGVILVNLGILFFFKYFDFVLNNINKILSALKLETHASPFSLLLPVGISFYTFQVLSYILDVYKGKIPAERNILYYSLFISFFPQLVAGPIERPEKLLPQLREMTHKKKLSFENFSKGLFLMCFGMFMKMVLADRLSILVDNVYDSLFGIGMVEGLIAIFGFTIQIYCDFAGYSLIAIGAARILDVSLSTNFDSPYLAVSIKDFWRRWHITLSGWFRDYVYIPLGGSRCSKARKYMNIMITFLVSGLWHGAGWTYVFWGGLHGLYQIVSELTLSLRKKIRGFFCIDETRFSFKLSQIVGTFLLTAFAWIFFRANNFNQAIMLIKNTLLRPNLWMLFDGSITSIGLSGMELNILFVGILTLVLFDIIKEIKKEDPAEIFYRQNIFFKSIVLVGLICSILLFGKYGIDFDQTQFIYFTF